MRPLFIDPMPFPSQVINLVSNLVGPSPGFEVKNDQWVSSSFQTGNSSYAYILSSVTLRFGQFTPGSLFVKLYSDATGNPGSEITSFNVPSISSTNNYNFTLTNPCLLTANTTYWLVAGVSSGSGRYFWAKTNSTAETGLPGWSIGNLAFFSNGVNNVWNAFPALEPFQFSINGQNYPLYPSNILLFLSGNGVNNSTNILDSSSYSRTLTRYGNTLINTAESRLGNGCIELDGNGDYLEFDYTPNFSFSGEFRVEAWIKAKVLSGSQVIISKDTFGVNFDFSILIVNNNSLVVYTDRTLQNLTVLVPTLNIGVWYKIVFERRLVSGILTNTIYLNDIAYGSNTMGITNDSQVKLTIGAHSWNNPNAFFNGFIEDLIITSPL